MSNRAMARLLMLPIITLIVILMHGLKAPVWATVAVWGVCAVIGLHAFATEPKP